MSVTDPLLKQLKGKITRKKHLSCKWASCDWQCSLWTMNTANPYFMCFMLSTRLRPEANKWNNNSCRGEYHCHVRKNNAGYQMDHSGNKGSPFSVQSMVYMYLI